MSKNMLDIIKSRDNRKVIGEMIQPRSKSIWNREREEKDELNFDDGIEIRFAEESFRMPLIRTEAFFDKLLDIDDDFAQEVNEILYGLEKDDSHAVLEILKEKYDDEIETDSGYMTGEGYTYNSENDFTRDFTYHIFEYNREPYVFITVHHGADARWGFGGMVCFKITDYDYFFSWQIQVYDESDNDYTTFDLEEIGVYDISTGEWTHIHTGKSIYLHTVADGF